MFTLQTSFHKAGTRNICRWLECKGLAKKSDRSAKYFTCNMAFSKRNMQVGFHPVVTASSQEVTVGNMFLIMKTRLHPEKQVCGLPISSKTAFVDT